MRDDTPKSLYSFEIWDSAGNLVALLDKATDRSLTAIRNRPGSASFKMSLDDPKATSAILAIGSNELRVKRGNKYLWGGQLASIESSLEGESGTVRVTAVGFLELFATRFTAASRSFTATDAGTIASTLIAEAQKTGAAYDTAKDYGVRDGTITASVTRTRSYEFKCVKDALIELSEVKNGFDFEITYDKKLNVYYPRQGLLKPELVFRYPGNIQRLINPVDSGQLINSVIARGAGLGASQPIVQRDDTNSQAGYKLRQDIIDYADIIETQTLQDHADEILRVRAVPVQIPELQIFGNQDPHIGDYWLGDSIHVKAAKGLLAIDNDYRVDQVQVDVSNDDVEHIVSLKVSIG